jgi:hypothetical protein
MAREWFSWNAIAEQWSRFTESVFVRVKTVLALTTPVFLTYNKDENIGRALERLRWAADIAVVGSHSTERMAIDG